MFSQIPVCHLVQGVPHVTITHGALDLTVQPPPPLCLPPSPNIWPGTSHTRPQTLDLGSHLPLTSCNQHWRPVQTCSLEYPPEVTSGGGHWSTYDLQAGGTHPTGMLSFVFQSIQKKNLMFRQFSFIKYILINLDIIIGDLVVFLSVYQPMNFIEIIYSTFLFKEHLNQSYFNVIALRFKGKYQNQQVLDGKYGTVKLLWSV